MSACWITGVDEDHEDLQGKIAASYELVKSGRDHNCIPAKGTDAVGHGTACAAIIKDLAPEAEVHSVKVIGANAKGSAEELVYGLKWCTENGMHIINASLGTLERRHRDIISDAVDEALINGVVVVAAANNGGHMAWPANLTSVLSVGADAMKDVFFHSLPPEGADRARGAWHLCRGAKPGRWNQIPIQAPALPARMPLPSWRDCFRCIQTCSHSRYEPFSGISARKTELRADGYRITRRGCCAG